jgi:uncharacterized protein (DUF3820 family)
MTKEIKPLTDHDLMPFGNHKDKRMIDVPASYLDYISQQDWIVKYPSVKAYIDNARKVIDLELKRGGR